MPIYAYRCAACGHAKDVLQKLSDPPLTVCPACGASSFAKQVTAAGFQLKGSGWYATDFKGGGSKKGDGTEGAKTDANTDAKTDASTQSDTAKGDTTKSDSAKPAKPAESGAGTKSGDSGGSSTGGSKPSSDSAAPKAAG